MNSVPIYDFAIRKNGNTSLTKRHYYGDTVRKILLASSLLLVILTPFFFDNLPLPFYLGIGFALLLNAVSGLTNPKSVWTSFLDVAFSLFGVIAFDYYAIDA